jgi:NADPH:quinone reductase-like Zn-dependent oxidoreductase
MHAAVIHKLREPPRYETFADPAAGENEVLVEVGVAGLHRAVKARVAEDTTLPDLPLAKQLGAGRVIATGRDQRVLDGLPELGADALIQLDGPTRPWSTHWLPRSRSSGSTW